MASKKSNKAGIGIHLWRIVFICYILAVVYLTLWDRTPSVWNDGTIMPLFSSYINAWRYSLYSEWRNIFLNYLLFVPLGFLAPLGIKGFRKLWKTTILAFLCSLAIELTQLYTGRGICEMDDILGNTLGAVIGFAIFSIISTIGRIIAGRKRK